MIRLTNKKCTSGVGSAKVGADSSNHVFSLSSFLFPLSPFHFPLSSFHFPLSTFLFLFFPLTVAAQDEPEYRMEVGGGLGLMAYQGDFNGSLTKKLQAMGGIEAKYRMNPRMSWAALLNIGKLKGSSENVKTWFPELRENPLEFSTTLTELSLRYEYNFWPFGTGKEYIGARPLTPFIAMGAGLVFAGKPSLSRPDPLGVEPKSVVAFQVPIGLGVKYKLRDRLNLTAEWMMHFTGSDKLDGVKDPYGIESSGLFKNTDCFSTLQLSLTYDIWARCKTCHNDL